MRNAMKEKKFDLGMLVPQRDRMLKTLGRLACALLMFCVADAFAQWHDETGNPIAETEAQKAIDGFSGMLVVTPDKDWQEKWNTPPETKPSFTTADSVAEGGELMVLVFLANPGLDASGHADVACDWRITRPNGRTSEEIDAPCMRGALSGDPKHVYMSPISVKFIAEPTDPRGTWQFAVTLKDRVRGVELPLKTAVEYR